MDNSQNVQAPQKMAPVQPAPSIHSTKNTPMVPVEKKESSGLIKTIIIIFLALTTITFVGLFIWMNGQYIDVSTDVEGQIAEAEAKARHEQEEKDLAQYAEDEKYPLRSFAGPVDYGQLSFEYPKTWSVYVSADAANGGNYVAYFNPLVVEPISKTNVNALVVTILDTPFEKVVAGYSKNLEKGTLSVESVTVAGTAANRYTGTIPGTDFYGVFVVFRIRDKTAIIRTDAMVFLNDFDALLSTVQFNA